MPPVEGLDPSASIRHKIAHDLRFFREQRGLSLADLAPVMGCLRTGVSNYEYARQGWNLQDRHAKALDEFYELPGHFQWLLQQCRSREAEDWFAEHLDKERKASQISLAELGQVPGLFQTEAYARAILIEAGSLALEAQLVKRMERQQILSRKDPPHVWALLDESILDRRIGGWDVMKPQLEWLIDLSARRNISIRIVPLSAGWHPGLSSSFKVLDVEGRRFAYTETTGGGRLTADRTEVEGFALRYRQIGAKALPEQISREIITATLEADDGA
ncbi:hypothetical protein EDD29_0429 [Actinocorallia herbida]|uniref:DUF5753 domain-containing protein n=1 Tax=Actinocorallia herbida TaxID=58109 RepID=A0A3N1CNS0_9ACTN|nr:helix-turn-helix transcriptional regulator [Actinocorallia herbida]ROO82942.1 hypothetical protein EDD29_0429 [Actinocorallia herbida]